MPNVTTNYCAECERLARERDTARAVTRVLAHAYTHDTRPPQRMVDEALEFPVRPEPMRDPTAEH